MKESFEKISSDLTPLFTSNFTLLLRSRTEDDALTYYAALSRALYDAKKRMVKAIGDARLQLDEDQKAMVELMDQKFGFNPKEWITSYEILGNTVRWTILSPYNEKHFYVSKYGVPVDTSRFYEWVINCLCN